MQVKIDNVRIVSIVPYQTDSLNVILCLFPGVHSLIVFGLQHVQLAQHGLLGCQRHILVCWVKRRASVITTGFHPVIVNHNVAVMRCDLSHPLDSHLLCNSVEILQLRLVQLPEARWPGVAAL